MTLQEQREKIIELAEKWQGSQVEKYKESIFLPYITLPNAKGKGMMMEEFFYYYLKDLGIDIEWKLGTLNYDFVINHKKKVELKVASIGTKDIVVFNQLHFSITREVDEFLLVIIRPDDQIEFYLVPKTAFITGDIRVQRQHSSDKNQCARLYGTYAQIFEKLSHYKVEVDKLKDTL